MREDSTDNTSRSRPNSLLVRIDGESVWQFATRRKGSHAAAAPGVRASKFRRKNANE
ncbi:hypothetical protein APY04_0573 [Hyphomicrobium sulfonivorans]|uniref:Uncharacterized protein n=1 Tax=Hyphomicrobium sulfonivorans TaxID=121290 RepID=A0A109BLC6_HYPSL|nr:hypothetical protein APY04_0573 [Hyphomicrobium sulfonivorans]